MSHRGPRWEGPRDGPWPAVAIDGELERAEREFLHTNGAGAYAMSTLALMHTRRHHGLLVAALEPPVGRYVILSHAETTVTVADRTFKLATHQFPGVAPTLGYRNLRTFAQDPLPRWLYRLGKGTLERTVALARGKNAVVLRYHWSGGSPARMSLMPLMPLRPLEHLSREHGGMKQKVTLRANEVEVQPIVTLPPIVFGHRGVFMGSPDWWRRFEYGEDLRRYSDFQEDMWTPGTFELTLDPDSHAYLVVGVGGLPSATPEELMAEAREHLLSLDPGAAAPSTVRTLSVACDSFSSEACSRPAIVAGYPWLGAPLRDWLIAFRGTYLARGRLSQATASLAAALQLLRAGLLPREVSSATTGPRVPSPDATLWLFEAARALADSIGLDDPFVKTRVYPGLLRAFLRLRGRRRPHGAGLSPEGFVFTEPPEPGTWMDARAGAMPVTPRNGLAVEHQALWFNACRTLAAWARYYGHAELARAAEDCRDAVLAGFSARFWCNETDYPFDDMSAERASAESWADASVRPNALIALAVAPELFEPWQADAILAKVRVELLTPRGIRTLSSEDRSFEGHYEGSLNERERALHQGSVWPFLLGFYVRAVRAQNPGDEDVRAELVELVERAVHGGPVLGHVAQIADGEEPHRWRGCPAQAWSSALLLSALKVDLAGT
ncbi:MAG: glycogen debranching enzyme N-terminal domain-containing protein [Myxococcales bacterium]|nr:glycogen debranching enzyme N-terminal domain-containing protein [Myxococcales bacterium]